MSTKKNVNLPVVFANKAERVEEIEGWLKEKLASFKEGSFIIAVSGAASPSDFSKLPKVMSRVLLVFEDPKVEMGLVETWRGSAMDRKAWEVHVAFLPFYDGTDEDRYKKIVASCAGWTDPRPEPEKKRLSKGQFVQMSAGAADRNLATLLTLTLGEMGELLTRIEIIARKFKGACPPPGDGRFKKSDLEKYLQKVDALLKEEKPDGESVPELENEPARDDLPKLLLRGDSGVGKSLIARYLHAKTGWKEDHVRIPIPEYLGKEDMFEYDLFGYCRGAYTDGKKEGSRGLLLSNVGRVVFLDEIGEANSYLQAKLLAFLDDYRVRPRGWEGKPFYCPVLVVAATNKDLVKMVEKRKFRGDLLARFTHRRIIPGLNERIGDLPFILDCLLQRQAMNPDLEIEEIGEGAYAALKDRDYAGENFRKLENLFRAACEWALRDARKYLVRADIEKAAEDEW